MKNKTLDFEKRYAMKACEAWVGKALDSSATARWVEVAHRIPVLKATRHCGSEENLKRYLEARVTTYQSILNAPNCDVLTIDDATVGAARACVLAREAGHEVILFVNPAQIARQRPYWFSRLDAILDERAVASVAFDGQEFDLSAGLSLRAFRLAIKANLMAMDELQRMLFLTSWRTA